MTSRQGDDAGGRGRHGDDVEGRVAGSAGADSRQTVQYHLARVQGAVHRGPIVALRRDMHCLSTVMRSPVIGLGVSVQKGT